MFSFEKGFYLTLTEIEYIHIVERKHEFFLSSFFHMLRFPILSLFHAKLS